MARRITLTYPSAGDFRSHLEEAAAQGVILLPTVSVPDDLGALESIAIDVIAGQQRCGLSAEVVQILSGAGLVVRITDTGSVVPSDLGDKRSPATPPSLVFETSAPDARDDRAVEQDPSSAKSDEGTEEESAAARSRVATPAGSSAISWPIEKLQAEWDNLNPAERIRVARYGNRGARAVVLRGRDKTLHVHLLGNSNISTEEVASLAGMGSLDPGALRRIAANREWLRSSEVTRNLVCHPKMPLPEVERLLRTMSRDELVRLSKSGRVRATVKQAATKRLKATTK